MQNNSDEVKLTKREARALLFWAANAVNDADGGSYQKPILDVIVRLTKEFKWTQENFCAIGYKCGSLGRELVKRLNRERELRIKLSD